MTKKLILTSAFIFSISGLLLGQSKGALTVKSNFFSGISFQHNGNALNFNNALLLVQQNEQAETFIRKSKNQATASGIVGAVGGVLIGLPIGTAIGGGEPNWNLLYIGSGIAVLSVPIYNSAVKNAQNGAEAYNISVTNSSTQMSFVVNAYGAGLKLSF